MCNRPVKQNQWIALIAALVSLLLVLVGVIAGLTLHSSKKQRAPEVPTPEELPIEPLDTEEVSEHE